MNKYHIRFNTKHDGSDLVWRIFENGTEHLVKDFKITVPMFGETTTEFGVQKWNVACDGFMNIIDDIAYIDSYNKDLTWAHLDSPSLGFPKQPKYEVNYQCEVLATK
jgi:hypothetical protein